MERIPTAQDAIHIMSLIEDNQRERGIGWIPDRRKRDAIIVDFIQQWGRGIDYPQINLDVDPDVVLKVNL